MTSIIINDFLVGRRSVTMLDSRDFEQTRSMLGNEDRILTEMQSHSLFEGRKKWIDLDILHWRILLIENLRLAGDLSDDELTQSKNDIVRSLHFLICGMILFLQDKLDCDIEMIHINRIEEFQVTYDFTASLSMNMSFPKPKQASGLHIVVDNSAP